jgi:hypothetical protein
MMLIEAVYRYLDCLKIVPYHEASNVRTAGRTIYGPTLVGDHMSLRLPFFSGSIHRDLVLKVPKTAFFIPHPHFPMRIAPQFLPSLRQ